jgi:hypothetical protein
MGTTTGKSFSEWEVRQHDGSDCLCREAASFNKCAAVNPGSGLGLGSRMACGSTSAPVATGARPPYAPGSLSFGFGRARS